MNIFIDPASSVKQVENKYAWLWPLLLTAVGTVIVSLASISTFLQIVERTLLPGLNPQETQGPLGRIIEYYRISALLSPLLLASKCLLSTGILFMACIILDVRVTFRNLFTLVAQCSLITLLQLLTAYLIIRLKGADVQTLSDLSPALGLDLLIRTDKPWLMAVVSYVSIFNVWYVLVLSLGLAYLSGCTKKKAFVATIPVWLLPLLLSAGLVAWSGA